MSLEPLTDYSKFKADCEKILARYQTPEFTTVTIRPATVCGYSPRQRLDVVIGFTVGAQLCGVAELAIEKIGLFIPIGIAQIQR